MSKQPSPAVDRPALSPATQAVLTLLQGLLPVMTALLGGLWVVFTYLDNQKIQAQQQAAAAQRQEAELTRQRTVRQFEARRPFLEKQLALYSETAAIVGKLVTHDPSEEAFREARLRFWQLYWSELSVVEDNGVASQMKQFGDALKQWETGTRAASAQDELSTRAYFLAQALRASIDASWRVEP